MSRVRRLPDAAPAPVASGAEPASRVAPPWLRRAWTASAVVDGLGALAGLVVLLAGVHEQHEQPTGYGGFDVFGGLLMMAVTLPAVVLFLLAGRLFRRRSTAAHVLAGIAAVVELLAWGTAAADAGAAVFGSGGSAGAIPLFLVLALVALWHLAVLIGGIVTEYPGSPG